MTDTMKISEVLKSAKEVIENPDNWTQEDFARDDIGDGVYGTYYKACQWCSVGAIQKATKENSSPLINHAVYYLDKAAKEGIIIYNDKHTHEEVMQVWDKAIALAEEDESVNDD